MLSIHLYSNICSVNYPLQSVYVHTKMIRTMFSLCKDFTVSNTLAEQVTLQFVRRFVNIAL
ncbi:unnamed protein product, partial [Dicrocoelium dendriticum]